MQKFLKGAENYIWILDSSQNTLVFDKCMLSNYFLNDVTIIITKHNEHIFNNNYYVMLS